MPTIHAIEKLVRDVFSIEFAFSVPRYQRPYSWGTEQATTLFDDLFQASSGFGPQTKPQSVTPYFLGSIVVIKEENRAEAEVVDGQQRLTTLALLLSALRVSFQETKRQNTFSALLLEEGEPLVGTQDRCRLTLRERDHDFFERNVLRNANLDHLTGLLAGELSDPQRNLAENCLCLLERVRQLKDAQRDSLAGFLLQHTFLVVVSTPNLESAFRIFAVLNDRGLDLTVADILKAEVIGKISASEEAAYVKKWEDAEEELGTERFAELFSQIRMIHERKKLRASVLEGFRTAVSLADPKGFIDDELLPLADASSVVLSADYECADKAIQANVNRTLGWLLRLGDRDWMPVALRVVTHYDTKPDLIQKLLTSLERVSVVMWLLRYDVNERIERHGEILASIASDTGKSGILKGLELKADEKKAACAVLAGDIYKMSPKSKRTFVLLRLDCALSSGEARYDFKTITVEHVLPQTPPDPSEWLSWWPDAQQRADCMHRFGNLALLNCRQNSAAKNWDFAIKKAKYFQRKTGGSPFQITSQVLKESKWTPETFTARQEVAMEKLTKLWELSVGP